MANVGYGQKMRLQECIDNLDQFAVNDRRFLRHVHAIAEAGDDLEDEQWERVLELWQAL